MSLQFINKRTIGPAERRLIRSHVMKGKNAGRPRQSRRKQRDGATKRDPRHPGPSEPESDLSLANHDYMRVLGLKRLLWSDLALTSFPYHVTSESKRIIHEWYLILHERLYPPEFCAQLDMASYIWFQYVFLDKAYFHGVLAISASFTDELGGNVKTFPESLKHLSQAYTLINQKLSGPDAVSNLAIAIVTTLAIYERIHNRQLTGMTHFDGLCRMIQLRGGMETLLKENRMLAQKPWRLDIEFAIQDGSRPLFNVDPNNAKDDLQFSSKSLHQHSKLSLELLHLMQDVAKFSDALNSLEESSKLDPLDYSEAVFSLLQRLLLFAPLGSPRPTNRLDDLVHLTLLAFMTTLLPVYGRGNSRYDLLSNHLRHALQSFVCSLAGDHELLLWAHFVGRVSILDCRDDQWLLPSLAETIRHLNLNGWLDVRRSLCEVSWLHATLDGPGQELWEKVAAIVSLR